MLNWFVPLPDVVRRRPAVQDYAGFFVRGVPFNAPVITVVNTNTTVVFGARRVQYQAKAAPVEPIIIPEPDFGWYTQEPDVIRTRQRPTEGNASPLGTPPILPDYGWSVQEPDVVRPPHQVREGGAIKGQPPILPSFGWFVQEPDVVQPAHVMREGGAADGFLPIIPAYGWQVQEPDVVQPAHVVREGATEGFLPIIPSFGWQVQEADIIRLHPPHPTGGQVGAPLDPIPDVDIRPFAVEGTLIYVVPDVLYQAKVDPLLPIVIAPDFGWYTQEPDVIRTRQRPTSGEAVLGTPPRIPDQGWQVQEPDVIRPEYQVDEGVSVLGTPPRIPDFGWFVQGPDIVLPTRPVDEGFYARSHFSTLPPEFIPDFGWYVAPADVVRPPARLVPEQSVLGTPPRVPAIGWLVAQPDVIRPPLRIVPGGEAVLGADPILPDIGWLIQEPDVVRPLHSVREGSFQFPPSLVPPPVVPDFGWHVQEPDVVRVRTRATEGQAVLQPVPILPAFGWSIQEPDVVRPLHQIREGGAVRGIPPLVVTGWDVQEPDVVRTRPAAIYTQSIKIEVPAVPAPDFGWFVQQVDIVRSEHQVRTGMFVLGALPILPSFGWFVAPADVIRPPLRIIHTQAEKPHEPPPPPLVTPLSWYPNFPDYLPKATWILTEFQFPYIEIGAPIPGAVFTIRVCLGLGDIFLNSLLPAASGYESPPTVLEPDPSGWEQEETNAPWDMSLQ